MDTNEFVLSRCDDGPSASHLHTRRHLDVPRSRVYPGLSKLGKLRLGFEQIL